MNIEVLARSARQKLEALTAEGFTREEALRIMEMSNFGNLAISLENVAKAINNIAKRIGPI